MSDSKIKWPQNYVRAPAESIPPDVIRYLRRLFKRDIFSKDTVQFGLEAYQSKESRRTRAETFMKKQGLEVE